MCSVPEGAGLLGSVSDEQVAVGPAPGESSVQVVEVTVGHPADLGLAAPLGQRAHLLDPAPPHVDDRVHVAFGIGGT